MTKSPALCIFFILAGYVIMDSGWGIIVGWGLYLFLTSENEQPRS